jgi:hypothetical protein
LGSSHEKEGGGEEREREERGQDNVQVNGPIRANPCTCYMYYLYVRRYAQVSVRNLRMTSGLAVEIRCDGDLGDPYQSRSRVSEHGREQSRARAQRRESKTPEVAARLPPLQLIDNGNEAGLGEEAPARRLITGMKRN